MQQDSRARTDEDLPMDDVTTYEDTEQKQEEFEALLRKYDGDFQKAVDAQNRGEKASAEGPANSSW